MPSQEETSHYAQSAHDPQDVAAATIAVAKARSELPAANWDFMNRMLDSRLEQALELEQRLRERSAELDKRAVDVERQIGARLAETEKHCATRMAETERHCAERLAALEQFCLDARKQTHDVIVTSHKQVGDLVTSRLAELDQIATATHALAKPAESRPSSGEVLGEVGKVVFGRLFDVFETSVKYNPDLARRVSRVGAAVLGGETTDAPEAAAAPASPPGAAKAPPPAEAPPTPAAPPATSPTPSYTLKELAEATEKLEEAALGALLERWGIHSIAQLNPEQAAELVAVYRKQVADA